MKYYIATSAFGIESETDSLETAEEVFAEYVERSKRNSGTFAGENIFLYASKENRDMFLKEYVGFLYI